MNACRTSIRVPNKYATPIFQAYYYLTALFRNATGAAGDPTKFVWFDTTTQLTWLSAPQTLMNNALGRVQWPSGQPVCLYTKVASSDGPFCEGAPPFSESGPSLAVTIVCIYVFAFLAEL